MRTYKLIMMGPPNRGHLNNPMTAKIKVIYIYIYMYVRMYVSMHACMYAFFQWKG